MDKWLKCGHCGSEIHADTIGGDLANHQCKDRQIAGMESELADYAETVVKLRAELQGCRERYEAWKDFAHKSGDIMGGYYPPDRAERLSEAINRLQSLGEL